MPISSYVLTSVPMGSVVAGMVDWQGPSSYSVVVPASPPTGGDAGPTPEQFGMSFFQKMEGGVSADGLWEVVPIITQNGTACILFWRAIKTATTGGQSQTDGLQAVATTDLSASVVRIMAFGG